MLGQALGGAGVGGVQGAGDPTLAPCQVLATIARRHKESDKGTLLSVIPSSSLDNHLAVSVLSDHIMVTPSYRGRRGYNGLPS